MEIVNLNLDQVTCILNRFNDKFVFKRELCKRKEFVYLNEETTTILNIYKKKCIYTKEIKSNIYKDHLVIKYTKKNDKNNAVVCLNISLDDYKDLL
jgi:hypothetical protein